MFWSAWRHTWSCPTIRRYCVHFWRHELCACLVCIGEGNRLISFFACCAFSLLSFSSFSTNSLSVCLFCSSTRNKSFPLSALPWNLNWTWIILTPSSHWSRSSWPRTIRKWHCRPKTGAVIVWFLTFRLILFCYVSFCLYLEYGRELSLALMMLLTGTKNILHTFILNSCNNSYMTLWALWEEILTAVWPMERSKILSYNNL